MDGWMVTHTLLLASALTEQRLVLPLSETHVGKKKTTQKRISRVSPPQTNRAATFSIAHARPWQDESHETEAQRLNEPDGPSTADSTGLRGINSDQLGAR